MRGKEEWLGETFIRDSTYARLGFWIFNARFLLLGGMSIPDTPFVVPYP